MRAEPDDAGSEYLEMRSQVVRELLLRRRRARVPWVYVVYHRCAGAPARVACAWPSVLTAKERRNVER